MMRRIGILLAATVAIGIHAPSSAFARTCTLGDVEMQRKAQSTSCMPLLPPRVEYAATPAALLHWGMSAADVVRLMGVPERVDKVDDQGSKVQVFRYDAEPFATTVTLVDGRLSGVALDIARFAEAGLPAFVQPVFLGLNREVVVQLLGRPAEDWRGEQDGMTLEQMIFKRPGVPEVSIFFIDGWAVKKQSESTIPADILIVSSPIPPSTTDEAIDAGDDGWEKGDGQVRPGMQERDVDALYGAPKLHVHYSFKGRPADYAIYVTQEGQSFAYFTFIDGVLTEFADGGKTPLDKILDGR